MKKKIKIIFVTINLFFIFLIGFFFGLYYNFIEEKNNLNVEFSINSFTKKIEFVENFQLESCDEKIFTEINNEIYLLGKDLSKLEKDKLENKKYYLNLKKKYTLRQISLFLLKNKFAKICPHLKKNTIIFFFDYTELSKKQGEILTKININDKYTILAMDYNYTEDFSYFYNYFNVEEKPNLIINEKVYGFLNEEELLNIINK